MRKLFTLLMALTLVCGLTANAMAATTTLTFMNWSSTEEAMKSIYNVIADFEKENPDIKIKNMPVGVGDIRNQFLVMVMGGNAPDVIQLHGGDAIVVHSMGAVHKAEDLYPKSFIDQMIPNFYEETRLGDSHAGVLWSPNTLTFFYNKKILKQLGYNQPPKTMKEMEEMMAKGKAKIKDLIGFQLDTTVRTVGFAHIWPFMNTFEYENIKGNVVKFNTPAMVEFGEWLRRMVNKGYTLPGKRFGEFRPMAAQGRVMFCIDGAQFRSHMKAFNKNMTDKEFDETWAAIPFPAGPSGKNTAGPDDHSLVVSKSTKHKEAAAKFVMYLTNTKSALTKYHDPAGFLPPIKNYADIAPGYFQDAGRQGTLKYAVPNVVTPPYGPQYVKVGTMVMTAMQEIITSKKPVKNILNSYQSKLEGVLQ